MTALSLRTFPRPRFLIALVVLAVVFALIAWGVCTGNAVTAADVPAFAAFSRQRTPVMYDLMIALTELGDTISVSAVAVTVAAWLLLRRTWRTALLWLAGLGLGSCLNTLIKVMVHRSRPIDLHLVGWSAYSFPSGHCATNAMLYGLLLVIAWRGLARPGRIVAVAASCGLVGLIAFSRLYLGAHWLSDVLGGLAFGGAWTMAAGLSRGVMKNEAPPARALALVWVATLAVVGGVHIVSNHAIDENRYRLPAVAHR